MSKKEYDNGQGVGQDFKEAVKWYQKAADQGDAEAQYSLGSHYDEGQGVEQDSKEAVKWYQKAADQGHAEAQSNLDGGGGGGDPDAPMGGPVKLGLILIGFLLLAGGIPIILEWMGVPVSKFMDWWEQVRPKRLGE